MDFFATAAKGTEPALRDELRGLRIPQVRCDRGGVNFKGEWEDAWRVCLHSRIALRVMAPLATFDASSEDALYQGTREIDWSTYVTPKHTLAVTAVCRSSNLTHTNFIALKTKDAIVDHVRDKRTLRPSIDRRDPDVQVFVHLVKNKATVYLDLVSESLHRRGYRRQTTEAPLKETLAASLLRLTGWDRKSPFIDPMCGSGTIAIEAAMWANNIAPGLARKRFGFERWPIFDRSQKKRLAELRAEAKDNEKDSRVEIYAMDIDQGAVSKTIANAKNAGVNLITDCRSVMDLEPLASPGAVVTNPPYGSRLEAGRRFYQDLGEALKRMKGCRVGVLVGKKAYQHAIKLKPEKYQILFNGDIECRLMVYQIN
jgi:putative N6-adenine-specific DNA methylase